MSAEKGSPLDGSDPRGQVVFDNGSSLPMAILFESAVEHNSSTMMSFCDEHGVSLAPHGKTTMAPYLLRRQIADGAWGITAATVWQALRMRDMGVDRVLIANEVVVPDEIRWLGRAIGAGFEVYCYVDSLDGVEILSTSLSSIGLDRPLPVLVEVGLEGGRTGARGVEAALEVADAAVRSGELAVTGVAGFEGIISLPDVAERESAIDAFLADLVAVANEIGARAWFQPSPEVLVTAGGSAYFDRVVAAFEHLDSSYQPRKILRSGCYITHDDGGYERSSPMGSDQRVEGRLVPAIEVWAPVLSRPEPGLALLGLGKRDVTYDGLLPLVKKVRRRGDGRVVEVEPFRVSSLNDQHAYIDLDPSDDLAVGDLVGLGISHPCTTFDKWRSMALVDDDYRVLDQVDTVF